ncbi:MAG: hypothetical protein N4A71_07705 [Carboxylicivirga sp.]|jgi:hypothetical protein|nr:hypothetical protein [Carboxylicivirga sp.]
MKHKINKTFFLLITLLFFLWGCQKEEMEINNRPLLKERFNGKYELISSNSKQAVDLNNDGIESTNLLDENSVILFSEITIRIPYEDELFLKENEFVFSELWPMENEHRLKEKKILTVYKKRVYSVNYDLYGNVQIGKFNEDLTSAEKFRLDINDDGKNTLVQLKSLNLLEDEIIRVIVVRKLFTKNGWVTTEIESLYKRYSPVT